MTTGGLRKKLEEGSTEQVTLEEATAEATHILADVATPAYRASLSNNPLLVAQRISQIAVDLREAAPGGIPIQIVLDKQRCVLKLEEQQRSGNKPRALSLPERYPEGSFTPEHDCMQAVFSRFPGSGISYRPAAASETDHEVAKRACLLVSESPTERVVLLTADVTDLMMAVGPCGERIVICTYPDEQGKVLAFNAAAALESLGILPKLSRMVMAIMPNDMGRCTPKGTGGGKVLAAVAAAVKAGSLHAESTFKEMFDVLAPGLHIPGGTYSDVLERYFYITSAPFADAEGNVHWPPPPPEVLQLPQAEQEAMRLRIFGPPINLSPANMLEVMQGKRSLAPPHQPREPCPAPLVLAALDVCSSLAEFSGEGLNTLRDDFLNYHRILREDFEELVLKYVDICPGDDDETSGRELRHRSRDFAGGDEDKLRGWTFYIGDVAEDLGLDAFKGWAPMQYHSLMEVIRNNHPDQYKRMFAAAKAAYERRSKKYPTPSDRLKENRWPGHGDARDYFTWFLINVYIKQHPDVCTAAQLFTTPANWPKEVQNANRFSLKQVQAAQAKSGKLPPWCDEAYDMIQADPDAPALLKEKSSLQLGRAFNNLRTDSPDNWDDLRKARSEERIELAEYKRRLAVAAAAVAAGTSGAHALGAADADKENTPAQLQRGYDLEDSDDEGDSEAQPAIAKSRNKRGIVIPLEDSDDEDDFVVQPAAATAKPRKKLRISKDSCAMQ